MSEEGANNSSTSDLTIEQLKIKYPDNYKAFRVDFYNSKFA